MARKLTYEELEQRIRDLQEESVKAKRAEEARLESEARYRRIIKGITDYVYTVRVQNGRAVETVHSPACEAVTGYTTEELEADPYLWIRMVAEEDRNRVIEHVNGVYEGREATSIEHRIVRRDGEIRWVSFTTISQIDPKGWLLSYDGVLKDITERKRMEDVLRESEERFKTQYQGSPTPTFTWQRQGSDFVLVDFNESAKAITHGKVSAFVGRKARELYTDRPEILSDLLLCYEERRVIRRETRSEHFLPGRLIVIVFAFVPPDLVMVHLEDVTERREAEAVLRESEARFREMADLLPQAIYETNAQGILTYVNRRAFDLFGYSRGDFERGLSVFQMLVAEERDRGGRAIRAVLAGNPPAPGHDREYRGLRRDGSSFPLEIYTSPIVHRGNTVGMRGILIDMTERRQAEEALKESQEAARHFARENEVMADIGRIVSSTLNIDEVYESFAREVGKIISFDRILISHIDVEKGTSKNAFIAGEEVPGRKIEEVYLLKGTGSAEMIRNRSSLLIQTEDFSEYQERFPMLASTFRAGFRSILNVPLFSKGNIIGGLLLRSRKPHAYTDEDVRLAERIASQIAGAIANARIYAERIQAEKERAVIEEQFHQAQKMESVGRLAGGVAHDFNNMLGIIIGNAELAALRVDPDDPLYQHLLEILKASRRSADTVRQLLAFARKQTISPKVVDLNDTVPGLLKMLRRLIGEDIELHWVAGKDAGTVRMDPSQVNQILANLVVNSRDAIPGAGKITIESANARFDEDYCREHEGCVPGEYVLLAVSDTGMGMTREIMAHLFDPFFTTREVGRGTGLGLATVYGIVKQNKGIINVYSEPGQGTTFKIYLPKVTGEAVTASEKQDERKLPEGTETVLLAEDEAPLLNIARDILTRQGYTVLAARTPTEALRLADKHQGEIHLLLTDVVMPGMNGRELMEKLQSLRPGMKGLFMSGYTANVVAHHGVLDEGVHFIEKPFSPIALAVKVREVLDAGD